MQKAEVFRKFVPEIIPLWLKNQNQHVHICGLMDGGGGGGAYKLSNTSVKEKVGLFTEKYDITLFIGKVLSSNIFASTVSVHHDIKCNL